MKLLNPIAWRPAVVLALTMSGAMATPASLLWPILAALLVPLLPGWRAKGIGLAGLILGFVLAPLPPRPVEIQTGRFDLRIATLPRPISGGESFVATSNGRRVAAWANARDLALGDRLRVAGTLRPLQRGPDDYLFSRGVAGRLSIRRLEVVERGPAWARWVADVSNGFGERLRERLGDQRGQLAAAIAFHLDGDLDPEADAVFRRSGAYHLVSASGLHAAVLAGALAWLGMRLPVPRGLWIAFAFLVLLGYCVLTGWHASTVRSALLWGLGSAAYLARRLPDALSALGLFVAFWLAVSPLDLYDVGFGLTVTVTAAIVAFRIEGPLRLHDIGFGLVAWLASEPIAMLAFGRATPLALPANLALGVASEIVLVLAVLTALPPFGFLAGITGACVDGLYSIARSFGHSAFAFWPTPWMTPTLAAILDLALLGAWLVREYKAGERNPNAHSPP